MRYDILSNVQMTRGTRFSGGVNDKTCNYVDTMHESQVELFFVYKDPFTDSHKMSTTSAHQRALADAGSESRPPMIERGPYQLKKIRPQLVQPKTPQTKDDLTGDDLKQYEADIESMNFFIISIQNDIFNSLDSCQTAQEMWLPFKRLMQGTKLNEIDREPGLIISLINSLLKLKNLLRKVHVLYTKEFKFSNDDFRRIFQLPQATDNNNAGFVAALSFSAMLQFVLDDLGCKINLQLWEEQGRRWNVVSRMNADKGDEADSSLSDVCYSFFG
nr:hypothetical protein [Tanacetum cinerariifolium]